jgi:outer membrane protein OmpA-like peptidoglycan-associated protein
MRTWLKYGVAASSFAAAFLVFPARPLQAQDAPAAPPPGYANREAPAWEGTYEQPGGYTLGITSSRPFGGFVRRKPGCPNETLTGTEAGADGWREVTLPESYEQGCDGREATWRISRTETGLLAENSHGEVLQLERGPAPWPLLPLGGWYEWSSFPEGTTFREVCESKLRYVNGAFEIYIKRDWWEKWFRMTWVAGAFEYHDLWRHRVAFVWGPDHRPVALFGTEGSGVTCAGALVPEGETALPPSLKVTARFDDASTGRSGALEGGETAWLDVAVQNEGPGAAGAVSLRITPDRPDALETTYGELGANRFGPGKVSLRLPVTAAAELGAGVLTLTLQLREEQDNDAAPFVLKIPTRPALLPRPVIDAAVRVVDANRFMNLGNLGPDVAKYADAVKLGELPGRGFFALERCAGQLFSRSFQSGVAVFAERDPQRAIYFGMQAVMPQTRNDYFSLLCVNGLLYVRYEDWLEALRPPPGGAHDIVYLGAVAAMGTDPAARTLYLMTYDYAAKRARLLRHDGKPLTGQTPASVKVLGDFTLADYPYSLAVSADGTEVTIGTNDRVLTYRIGQWGAPAWQVATGQSNMRLARRADDLIVAYDAESVTYVYQTQDGAYAAKRALESKPTEGLLLAPDGALERVREGAFERAAYEGGPVAAPHTRAAFTRGNGNGVAENGELVDAVLTLRNEGTGPWYGPALAIEAVGAENVAAWFAAGVTPPAELRPGAAFQLPVKLALSHAFRGDGVPLRLRVADVRSRPGFVPAFATTVTVAAGVLKPRLAYDYRLHDGDSPNSRGNRNGAVEPGEVIELEVAVRNLGDVGAPRGSITVASPRAEITFSRSGAALTDLQPTAPPQTFTVVFAVKRSAASGLLPITFTVTPDAFEPIADTLNLTILEAGAAPAVYSDDGRVGGAVFVAAPEAADVLDADPAAPAQNRLVRLPSRGVQLERAGKPAVQLPEPAAGVALVVAAADWAAAAGRVIALGSDGRLYALDLVTVVWQALGGPDGAGAVITLVHVAGSAPAFLLQTAAGLWRSADDGRTWAPVAQPGGSGRLVAADAPGVVLYEAAGGVLLSRDGGATFAAYTPEGVDAPIVFLAARRSGTAVHYFAMLTDGRLLRSTDDGRSFALLDQLEGCARGCRIGDMVLDSGGSTLFVAVGGLGVVRVDLPAAGKGTPARHATLAYGLGDASRLADARLAVEGTGRLLVRAGGDRYALAAVRRAERLAATGFRSGSAELPGDLRGALDAFAEAVKREPGGVLVAGHTDNLGSAEDNQVLSERRAELVKAYLVSRGVESARISAQGYGMHRPVADNQNEEGRSRNRRVDLLLAAGGSNAAPPAAKRPR